MLTGCLWKRGKVPLYQPSAMNSTGAWNPPCSTQSRVLHFCNCIRENGFWCRHSQIGCPNATCWVFACILGTHRACTFPERTEALSPLGLLFYVKLQLVELASRPTYFHIFAVTLLLLMKKKEFRVFFFLLWCSFFLLNYVEWNFLSIYIYIYIYSMYICWDFSFFLIKQWPSLATTIQ